MRASRLVILSQEIPEDPVCHRAILIHIPLLLAPIEAMRMSDEPLQTALPRPVSAPDLDRRDLLKAAAASLGLVAAARPITTHATSTARTAYGFAPAFLDYVLAPAHVESPARARAIQAAMQHSGVLSELETLIASSPAAALEATLRVHSAAHVETVRNTRALHHEQAQVGVAMALAATEAVLESRVRNAFVASRPPGHHALDSGREEGFCYYNNIAIAAEHARARYGLSRILICDWDYHHGNATEAFFYRDPHTLFFSTHDVDAYPWTGFADRRGAESGEGYNINVPLPCGARDEDITRAFREHLLPAADRFQPELVLISAGFDSRVDDLLGCFAVSDAGFRELSLLVLEIAERHAAGRVVSILEGGYQPSGTASAVVTHVTALLGH